MSNLLKATALMVCATVLPGCATTKIYVDPQYHQASYESIRQLAAPMLVKVSVHFQRDGNPLPIKDDELRGPVERTLRATRVFTPTKNTHVPIELTVVANNITDPAAARAKGFASGKTDGAEGQLLDDNYAFNFTYLSINNHQPVQATYLHALHIAPGSSPAKASTFNKAFGQVVEDVVLNFVKDLQDKGQI